LFDKRFVLIWLIAEDEVDILNLLTMVIQVWGHKPLVFESGQKVWDWLDKIESGTFVGDLPHFALMDIRMPGKKGNEVAHRMRKMSAFQQIPLALMTAYSLTESEQQQIQSADGVDAIISKPLPTFDELLTTLNRIIANKRISEPGVSQSP
jgi:CheY-like chemotaxis protein